MHNNNNNYKCKMCWNKALTLGVDLIKLSFRASVHAIHAWKDVFNSNVTINISAESLYFSAFLYYIREVTFIAKN